MECKVLIHVHTHTSECSLTGVRKQSKLFHGYFNYPGSQHTRQAQRDLYCSTCMPKKIPHPLHPPNTHKENKLPGTFLSGATSYGGEGEQKTEANNKDASKQQLAQFRDTSSTEMLVTLKPRALVDMRCYWCYCSCLFCFHPLLLGEAISLSCPINAGRVGVLLEEQ